MTDIQAGPLKPRPKRTRIPKRRRQFDLPDEDDEREPLVGPGADPKGGS